MQEDEAVRFVLLFFRRVTLFGEYLTYYDKKSSGKRLLIFIFAETKNLYK